MRFRFTIRDLLWLTLVVALAFAPDANADDAPAPKNGTLKGRFIYNGSAPEPKVVVVYPTEFGGYHVIDESLLVPRMLGIQNIFIWVCSTDIPIPAHDKFDPVTVEFKEGRIAPHALAFQAPCRLILENGDLAASCNFNGNLKNNMHIGLNVLRGQQGVVQIGQSETVPVHLTSRTYSFVSGWILPLNHPYFAISNEGGEFKIENLPLGKWEFEVWHERKGYLETADWKDGRFTLEIKPGENDLGIIKLDPKLFKN